MKVTFFFTPTKVGFKFLISDMLAAYNQRAAMKKLSALNKENLHFLEKARKIFEVWFKKTTGWPEEFSRSLSHRNNTFCSKKILLGTSRHSRALGFQPCTPIFYIYLCTVGHQNFQDQKFQIGLLATQKQIKTYWMTKPHQNNHRKFWLAGFFNTSKIFTKWVKKLT